MKKQILMLLVLIPLSALISSANQFGTSCSINPSVLGAKQASVTDSANTPDQETDAAPLLILHSF
ncbi:hypothetical protein KJS94_06685 [Flavihumibacter rivuli]|uniref:hypothetical protein n=1 Tax=Flavihumibacter rivuli TaxID=2838156 RepID=UPI001BDE96AB|nr:hypothetical protein [Flavihumibacter rivuli]ULQ57883.1 hypothetical protein KJS94_06685 [Flavihumibacter rivuli]